MPTNSFIVKNVLLYTGHEFQPNGFVVVRDGTIATVGIGDPPAESGLAVISKPDHTLIPGLIDSHIHGLEGDFASLEQPLRFGVTTVCDLHNAPLYLEKLAKAAQDPNTKGKYADFKHVGLGAMVKGGWPEPVIRKEAQSHGLPEEVIDTIFETWPKLTAASEAAPYVAEQVARGASMIKLFQEEGSTMSMELPVPRLEIQQAVVKAAHAHGLSAIGHALSYQGAMILLEAGVDGLTHMFLEKAPDDEWIQIMKQKSVHCNPTLACSLSLKGQADAQQRRWTQDPFAQKMLLKREPKGNIGLAAGCHHADAGHALENAKALYRAGVPLIVGSDAAGTEIGCQYGLGVHMEMHRMIHEVGMKVEDVLRGATSLTAERFGFKDRGSIAEGALADLVLVEGDVRESLSDKENLCLSIKGVWRGGVFAEAYRYL
ncbi:hypothetical protein F5Y18DRAFT_435863 [Xylariaceae sp. FL1019]|nr:hypothetical protein F5Y18DRAFT_435863 [Xylariaceae sp. FL1019]